MIQVRLILQPVMVEKSAAPILLYGDFFRFSPDHTNVSNNGDIVFVPADGIDMFVLLQLHCPRAGPALVGPRADPARP